MAHATAVARIGHRRQVRQQARTGRGIGHDVRAATDPVHSDPVDRRT
jgi:hypothetical protein